MEPVHRSTLRVIEIFECVSLNRNGITLTEIASSLCAPKSSIFPIVKTLAENRYLYLNRDNNRYTLGFKALEIGYAYIQNNDILDDIRAEMEYIVEMSGETCYFGQLDGKYVFYLLKVDSPASIRMVAAAGRRLPAYSTAIGKALLSSMSKDQLLNLYTNNLVPVTQNTLQSTDELFQQIRNIRKTGFSWEIEESEPLIRCIAVPIMGKDGVIAAMSVAFPVFRFSDAKQILAGKLLLNAKKRIEKLIEFGNIAKFPSI